MFYQKKTLDFTLSERKISLSNEPAIISLQKTLQFYKEQLAETKHFSFLA